MSLCPIRGLRGGGGGEGELISNSGLWIFLEGGELGEGGEGCFFVLAV